MRGFHDWLISAPGRGWDGGWENFEDSRRSGVSIRALGPWAQGLWAQGPWAQGPWAQGPCAQGPWAQGPWAQGPWALALFFLSFKGKLSGSCVQVSGRVKSGRLNILELLGYMWHTC